MSRLRSDYKIKGEKKKGDWEKRRNRNSGRNMEEERRYMSTFSPIK